MVPAAITPSTDPEIRPPGPEMYSQLGTQIREKSGWERKRERERGAAMTISEHVRHTSFDEEIR